MQKLLITILLIAVSISSALAGAWYFNRYHGNEYRTFTVDVKAIVAYRKIPREETAAGIEKELGEFLKALDGKLTAYDVKGSVLMVKDAVLAGEAIDITKEVGKDVGVNVTPP